MAPKNNAPATPRIGHVTAVGGHTVKVNWSAGPRAGSTETIDLSPIINAMKFFRPLRSDAALFATVHSVAYGTAIAWGDDEEIDMSVGAVFRLAEETMRPEDMRTFITRQGLTETSLAATLDYSRRQIVGFINEGRPIPRVVSLACRYLDLVKHEPQPKSNPDTYKIIIPRAAPISLGSARSSVTSSSSGPVPVQYPAMKSYVQNVLTSTVPSHVDL